MKNLLFLVLVFTGNLAMSQTNDKSLLVNEVISLIEESFRKAWPEVAQSGLRIRNIEVDLKTVIDKESGTGVKVLVGSEYNPESEAVVAMRFRFKAIPSNLSQSSDLVRKQSEQNLEKVILAAVEEWSRAARGIEGFKRKKMDLALYFFIANDVSTGVSFEFIQAGPSLEANLAGKAIHSIRFGFSW